LGWEVWLNGMEVTQFTYFQQAGGLECRPVLGEITYGLERLCMYLQNVDNVYDLVWTIGPQGPVTYGDVYHQNEVEQSAYNFEHADVAELFHRFDACEAEALRLVEAQLPLPAYEQVCKASHTFNLLDARRAISVTERQRYILRVRTLAQAVARAYYAQREKLGFPGLKRASTNGADVFHGCTDAPPADRTGHRGAAGQGPAGPGPGLLRRRHRRPGQARHRLRGRRRAPAVHPAAPGRAAAEGGHRATGAARGGAGAVR